jgi:uncharacterized protein (TIGR02996 family)
MTPSTDEESFLRMIEADRQDDATRLIYADWLEENGQAEKAEYLRLHVEFDDWTFARRMELIVTIKQQFPHWLCRVRKTQPCDICRARMRGVSQ